MPFVPSARSIFSDDTTADQKADFDDDSDVESDSLLTSQMCSRMTGSENEMVPVTKFAQRDIAVSCPLSGSDLQASDLSPQWGISASEDDEEAGQESDDFEPIYSPAKSLVDRLRQQMVVESGTSSKSRPPQVHSAAPDGIEEERRSELKVDHKTSAPKCGPMVKPAHLNISAHPNSHSPNTYPQRMIVRPLSSMTNLHPKKLKRDNGTEGKVKSSLGAVRSCGMRSSHAEPTKQGHATLPDPFNPTVFPPECRTTQSSSVDGNPVKSRFTKTTYEKPDCPKHPSDKPSGPPDRSDCQESQAYCGLTNGPVKAGQEKSVLLNNVFRGVTEKSSSVDALPLRVTKQFNASLKRVKTFPCKMPSSARMNRTVETAAESRPDIQPDIQPEPLELSHNVVKDRPVWGGADFLGQVFGYVMSIVVSIVRRLYPLNVRGQLFGLYLMFTCHVDTVAPNGRVQDHSKLACADVGHAPCGTCPTLASDPTSDDNPLLISEVGGESNLTKMELWVGSPQNNRTLCTNPAQPLLSSSIKRSQTVVICDSNNNSSKVHNSGKNYHVDILRLKTGDIVRGKKGLPPILLNKQKMDSLKLTASKKLFPSGNLPYISSQAGVRETTFYGDNDSAVVKMEGKGVSTFKSLTSEHYPDDKTTSQESLSKEQSEPHATTSVNKALSGATIPKLFLKEETSAGIKVLEPCSLENLSEVIIGGATDIMYSDILEATSPIRSPVPHGGVKTAQASTSCDNDEEEESESVSETDDEEDEEAPAKEVIAGLRVAPWVLRTTIADTFQELHDHVEERPCDPGQENEEVKSYGKSSPGTNAATPFSKRRRVVAGKGQGPSLKAKAGAVGRKAAQGRGEGANGGENSANKGAGEGKKEKGSDQAGEGAGDESLGKSNDNSGGSGGGGGGGGGGRKGAKNSKAPACALPSNMQPTFYVSGGNNSILVEGPLLELGWKKTTDKHDERYKLKWVENRCRINYIAFREGEQLVNHIPNCKLLTNKLGLLCSLQEYERVTVLTKGRLPRLRMVDFVPETYKLDEKTDREKFLNEYKDGETWICKPTSLNQGKGIFLLRSRDEITQLLNDREAKTSWTRQVQMRIVQRYIHNPLLIDGRKFDIRVYMFIASTVPFLVLFHNGYVRLSCQKYSQDDPNLTTHLTNQFVQKKDPSYKDNKEDTAWTMEKLNEYINENVAKDKNLEKDWVFGGLTKQMQRITLHCFNSVKHKLQCKIGYFDLYGMDFMVDADLKVWLIEINANPALWTNCQALKEAIPCVVRDALYVAIECFEKSRRAQSLLPLNSLGGYQVLYCGSGPSNGSRQARSVSPFKDSLDICHPSGTSPVPGQRRQSPPRSVQKGNNNNTGSNMNPKPEKKSAPSSTLPTITIGASGVVSVPSRAGLVGGAHHSKKHQSFPQQQISRVSLVAGNQSVDENRIRLTHANPIVGKEEEDEEEEDFNRGN